MAGTKFEVTYDTLDKLEKDQATVLEQPEGSYELPPDVSRAVVIKCSVMAIRGVLDVSVDGLRNDEFPDIHPITVEELIQKAWGSK
jgi:hypothetical protein